MKINCLIAIVVILPLLAACNKSSGSNNPYGSSPCYNTGYNSGYPNGINSYPGNNGFNNGLNSAPCTGAYYNQGLNPGLNPGLQAGYRPITLPTAQFVPPQMQLSPVYYAHGTRSCLSLCARKATSCLIVPKGDLADETNALYELAQGAGVGETSTAVLAESGTVTFDITTLGANLRGTIERADQFRFERERSNGVKFHVVQDSHTPKLSFNDFRLENEFGGRLLAIEFNNQDPVLDFGSSCLVLSSN
jgi:hypothetical protein